MSDSLFSVNAVSDTTAQHGHILPMPQNSHSGTAQNAVPDSLWHMDIYKAMTTETTRPTSTDTTGFTTFQLERVLLPEGTGVTGDLPPYEFRTDNGITCALLLCFFIMACIIFRHSTFMYDGIRRFFRLNSTANEFEERTETEFHLQLFLIFQTCFMTGLILFSVLYERFPEILRPMSPHSAIAAISGIIFFLILIKRVIYSIVNHVFFNRNQCRSWMDIYLQSITISGLLLIPATILGIYQDLTGSTQLTYFLCVFGSIKLLLLYKCLRTFFKYKWGWVHLILYFCTLEIIPMVFAWRALTEFAHI